MRLICGFLHLDGSQADSARLDAMVSSMTPPGLTPRIARHVQGPVALATLAFGEPLEALRTDASGLVMAADVRLDAPDRLADALSRPRSTPDDALLFAAMERNGPSGFGDVLGDYALAAWDPRQRTLLCARDAMGIRPLFLQHREGATFAFASRPSGLHAAGFAPRRVDEQYLLSHMVAIPPGPERSLFQGISRLPPGSWLRLSCMPDGGERLERGHHWQLDRSSAGRNALSPEQAAEELAGLVAEAVRCRLPASGPVAAHLSGGLDSSSIAVLAARQLWEEGRSLLAYSFFPATLGDFQPVGERPYVDAVLRQEPELAWTAISVGAVDAGVPPAIDSNQLLPIDDVFPDIQVCADAAAKGAHILLSGWGGDEGATYNGRGAFAEALLAGRWRWLAREVRAMATVHGLSRNAVIRGEILPYLLSPSLRRWVRRLQGRSSSANLSAFVRDMLHEEAARRAPPPPPALRPDTTENRFRFLSGPMLQQRTEEWALMAARHGVAVTFPMLDRRVVEFALSLPSRLFVREGSRRRVFRDAMAGVLPPKVLDNPKKTNPFPENPLRIAAARDRLLTLVALWRENPTIADLLDLDAIAAFLRTLPDQQALPRSAETLCDNSDMVARSTALSWILRHACYLDQHQDGPAVPAFS